MRTLIVLCGGNQKIENVPLFLMKHPSNKLIAEKAIEGIFPENYDNIVFSIIKDDEEKYNVSKMISQCQMWKNVKVCYLDKQTSGPAQTAYETIKKLNITGEIVIRDSDNYIEIEKDIRGNFIVGLDLTKYEKTIENLRNKSFIVLNEQKQVLDIIEKRFRSDIISVGLYGFESANDYIFSYERLKDKNYPINKLYISHIISYLIGYNEKIFNTQIIDIFEDWSSNSLWIKTQKQYGLYICDIELLSDNKNLLKIASLSKSGACFLILSSNEIKEKEKFEVELRKKEINFIGLIDKCSKSNYKKIIKSINEIEM